MPPISRRKFLAIIPPAAVGMITGLSSRPARAIGPMSEFKIAQLRGPGASSSRQKGLAVLAREIRIQTSIDISLEIPTVSLNDKSLYDHAFLVWVGDRGFGSLSSRQLGRLKGWLEAGGTLFVDNVGNVEPSAAFDEALRSNLNAALPRQPLVRIPPDHVLYRSFYRIDYPAGRRIAHPYIEGIHLDGRLAVIYSQNDMTGAWSRDGFGNWDYDVRPGGERQREVSLRLGVNLIEYVLCQDYKDDQVHMDYLLHKRKWKIRSSGSSKNKGEK